MVRCWRKWTSRVIKSSATIISPILSKDFRPCPLYEKKHGSHLNKPAKVAKPHKYPSIYRLLAFSALRDRHTSPSSHMLACMWEKNYSETPFLEKEKSCIVRATMRLIISFRFSSFTDKILISDSNGLGYGSFCCHFIWQEGILHTRYQTFVSPCLG